MLGQRARCDPLREEAVEVGLVLGVFRRALEALRLAIRAARRPALVAHLVDLAPAPGALRLVLVVRHLACQSNVFPQAKRAAFHRVWAARKTMLAIRARSAGWRCAFRV